MLLQKNCRARSKSPPLVYGDGRQIRATGGEIVDARTAKGVAWTDGVARGWRRNWCCGPRRTPCACAPAGFEADYEGRLVVTGGGVADRQHIGRGVAPARGYRPGTSQRLAGRGHQGAVGRWTDVPGPQPRPPLKDEADYCDLAHRQVYRGAARGRRNGPRRRRRGSSSRRGRATGGGVFTRTAGPSTAWAEDVGHGTGGLHAACATTTAAVILRGGSPSFLDGDPRGRFGAALDGQGAKDQGLDRGAPRPLGPRARLRWGERTVSGEDFYLRWGRRRGWHELKSTRFNLKRTGDRYVFTGGPGPRRGLCQHGAAGRARSGFGFREILEAYFPGGLAVETRTVITPPRRQSQKLSQNRSSRKG